MVQHNLQESADTSSKKPIAAPLRRFLSKNKLGRLINSFVFKEPGRKGQCTPDKCSTLDGKTGSACCKLGYTCPALCESSCRVYGFRPRNCRVYPANREDIKLVKNCGYWWE
jgi:hypothetical protein